MNDDKKQIDESFQAGSYMVNIRISAAQAPPDSDPGRLSAAAPAASTSGDPAAPTINININIETAKAPPAAEAPTATAQAPPDSDLRRI